MLIRLFFSNTLLILLIIVVTNDFVILEGCLSMDDKDSDPFDLLAIQLFAPDSYSSSFTIAAKKCAITVLLHILRSGWTTSRAWCSSMRMFCSIGLTMCSF